MKLKFKKETMAAVFLVITIVLILVARYAIVKVDSNSISLETNGITFEKENIKLIKVHISGEVANPGVYELEEGARVDDLVKLCGGLSQEADVSRINLAKKLTDEDKILIYPMNNEDDEVKYVGIDVFNYGSEETILNIDGIGVVLAKRIIDYRDNKLFSSYEDLLEVEGIGEGKLDAIVKYLEIN